MRDPDQCCAGLGGELLHLVEDLRLDRDVEGGRRLVGDDQIGLVQQRDRDRDALAHAAGELVRVGAQPLVGRGDADAGERVPRARARLVAADVLVRLIASIICVSIRKTGLSVIIGSWKIIAMRAAAQCGAALLAEARPGPCR